MTTEQVKADLREIRYYYAHEKDFENGARVIGESAIAAKAERYNALVCKAPSRLYYLYLSLYIRNNTQMVAADDADLSVVHVKRLNRALCEYLRDEMNKGGEA